MLKDISVLGNIFGSMQDETSLCSLAQEVWYREFVQLLRKPKEGNLGIRALLLKREETGAEGAI